MDAKDVGKLSDRSVRARWTQTVTSGGAPEGKYLDLVTGAASCGTVFSSVASYENEHHLTVTLPDDRTVQKVRKAIAKDSASKDCFDNNFNGLTILKSPSTCEIDICAVHGLEGNAVDSFTSASKLWLRDLLPETSPFDKARIMTFGYNSKLIESRTTAGMNDWADNLLRAVGQVRTGNVYDDRPIIFICHSMGGLVTRRAVERLHQFGKLPDQYPGMKLKNCGILFLSTPHLGTTSADYGKLFCQLLSSMAGLREDAILRELRSFNSAAGDTIEMWKVMDPRPPFECLCESKRTRIGMFSTKRELVTPVAASFLDQKASQIPNADHREVCKFDSTFSQGYKDIIAKLNNLRSKLLQSNTPAVRATPPNLPAQPRITSYRYPLPQNQRWYLGDSLKLRSGHFQGRQMLLKALQQATEIDPAAESNKVIALTGIGGVGKTEILLEYGLHARQTNHIFFCQASAGETFQSCIYRLATIIGSEVLSSNVILADREPVWNSLDKQQRVDAFIKWLQSSVVTPSIILFDDVDAFRSPTDFTDLSTVLRTWPHTVILSTRDPYLGESLADESYRTYSPHIVDALPEDVLEPIMRRYITRGLSMSREDLGVISRAVDGHAMAACRAVQFICQELDLTSTNPVREFIQSFNRDNTRQEVKDRFLEFRPRLGKSLSTCFETSIQRLGDMEWMASRVLNFAIYLTVPEYSFRTFFQHKRPWLDEIPHGEHLRTRELFQMSDIDFGKSLHQLVRTSALIRTSEGHVVVHKMMTEYLLHRQRQPGRINILRQILLLAKASIQLNDDRKVFEKIVANCEAIASKFDIAPEVIAPPPQILRSIGRFDLVRSLSQRLTELSQRRQFDPETLADEKKRSKYLEDARRLTFEFERMKEFLFSQDNASGAHTKIFIDMVHVVRGVNPLYFHKLYEERPTSPSRHR